jgi:hypothetical protein
MSRNILFPESTQTLVKLLSSLQLYSDTFPVEAEATIDHAQLDHVLASRNPGSGASPALSLDEIIKDLSSLLPTIFITFRVFRQAILEADTKHEALAR